MPNKQGGKNYKKLKYKDTNDEPSAKLLMANSSNQQYAKVIKQLGGVRMQVQCENGNIVPAIIRGSFRKRIWLKPDDILLVEFDDMSKKECHILHKYNNGDIMTLKNNGLISFDINKNNKYDEFEFKEINSDDEEADVEDSEVEVKFQVEDASTNVSLVRKMQKKDLEKSRSESRRKKEKLGENKLNIDDI